MTARFRRVAVFVGTAALATGAGIGVAASQGDPTDRTSGTPTSIERGAPGGGGRFDISTIADTLGVSEADLQQAMQTAGPAADGPEAMVATVADALGLSEDTVRAAFESGRPPQSTTRS